MRSLAQASKDIMTACVYTRPYCVLSLKIGIELKRNGEGCWRLCVCMFEEQADSVPRIPTLDSTTGGLLREKEKK